MHFSSPIWLLGLLPWLAALIVLVLRRHTTATVPHLGFWPSGLVASKPRRSIVRLPLAWFLLMMAVALAVLDAAAPSFGRRGTSLWVSFDGSPSQLNQCLDRVAAALPRVDPDLRVAWEVPPTLRETILRRQRELSGHSWIVADNEAIQPKFKQSSTIRIDSVPGEIGPTHLHVSPVAAIDVLAVAVTNRPRQMMVHLRNNSAGDNARLRVEASQSLEIPIKLPMHGETFDAFVDLPAVAPLIFIRVVDDSERPLCSAAAWHADWLPVRLQAVESSTPALERFCGAYREIHPPAEGSTTVFVGSQLAPEQAGVVAPLAKDVLVNSTITQQPHPVLAHSDLSVLKVLPTALCSAPGDDWQIIARANGRPILAVRELPVRQVWLGFSADAFEQREGFVVLLADAVDWISQGGDVQGHLDIVDGASTLPDDVTIERAIRAALGPRRNLASLLSVAAVALVLLAAVIRR